MVLDCSEKNDGEANDCSIYKDLGGKEKPTQCKGIIKEQHYNNNVCF